MTRFYYDATAGRLSVATGDQEELTDEQALVIANLEIAEALRALVWVVSGERSEAPQAGAGDDVIPSTGTQSF